MQSVADHEPTAANAGSHPPLPVVDVAGSPREIGRGVGEALRDGLQHCAEGHRQGLDSTLGWQVAMDIAARLEPLAMAAIPDLIEELRGMAEGSGVPFATLFSMNALQETRFLAGRDAANVSDQQREDEQEDEGCTSLAVSGEATANGHVYVAHNEDAGTIRRAFPYVVRARPTNRPAFVAFAYSGLMLYQGVNEHGVASTGNALYASDLRPGVPKLFAYRDVLNATFLEDGLRRTIRPQRANGNNHLIANDHGELYDVEVTGGRWALLEPQRGWIAHTNHLRHPDVADLESGDTLNSIMRLRRVERLLDASNGQHSVDTIFGILSDHSNYPKSVCKHPDAEHNPHAQTVSALVIDVTARVLHVRPGFPCSTPTTVVALDG